MSAIDKFDCITIITGWWLPRAVARKISRGRECEVQCEVFGTAQGNRLVLFLLAGSCFAHVSNSLYFKNVDKNEKYF